MPDSTLLAEAASSLESAAARVDDDEATDRLENFAGQLEDIAESGQTPDHGRLARILHSLSEIADDADGEAADAIARAREQITTYREGVEGV
jgi:hypothetical protein